MNRPSQVAGSLFVLALVGVISLTASTYLRADGDDDDGGGGIPVPVPVISAAPLQVAALAPLPVMAPAPLPVVLAAPQYTYKTMDAFAMFGPFRPGFGFYPLDQMDDGFNAMAAQGWEFVEKHEVPSGSTQHVWLWRKRTN